MIIICPCKKKTFEIDAALIPDKGRTLKCGSCDHVWFYKKDQNHLELNQISHNKEQDNPSKIKQTNNATLNKQPIKERKSKSSEIVKYKPKSNFTFISLLSYIMVLIISFIALIIILDTLKSPLYKLFPKLEFFLFNLYETLKDIQLFIKDLIKK